MNGHLQKGNPEVAREVHDVGESRASLALCVIVLGRSLMVCMETGGDLVWVWSQALLLSSELWSGTVSNILVICGQLLPGFLAQTPANWSL